MELVGALPELDAAGEVVRPRDAARRLRDLAHGPQAPACHDPAARDAEHDEAGQRDEGELGDGEGLGGRRLLRGDAAQPEAVAHERAVVDVVRDPVDVDLARGARRHVEVRQRAGHGVLAVEQAPLPVHERGVDAGDLPAEALPDGGRPSRGAPPDVVDVALDGLDQTVADALAQDLVARPGHDGQGGDAHEDEEGGEPQGEPGADGEGVPSDASRGRHEEASRNT